MLKKYLFLVAATTVACILMQSSVYAAEKKVIVGFRNAPGETERTIIQNANGKIKKEFGHVQALSADIDESELAALRNNPNVEYVEEDVLIQAIGPITYSNINLTAATGGIEYQNAWSVSHIGSQTFHDLGITGAGVKIAVLDTGIDYNHSDLDMNYGGGDNFISTDPNNHDPLDDSFSSHGTHVAGTIAAELNGVGVVGVAPEATIYAVKVLDGAGFGSVSSIVAGIEWAVANQMDIVNMSIGFGIFSQSLADACAAAHQAGLLLVAAAGNTYGGPVLYPAAFPSVIAVGATTIYDDISFLSPVGPEVELTAPGLNIYSTVAYGGYGFLGGTSQAAPHVSGVAALLMTAGVGDIDGNGIVDNQDIRLQLQNTAIDLGDPGVDPVFGYGLLNATVPPEPPVHLVIEKLNGDTPSTSIADGVYEVSIVNTSLSKIKISVFEAGIQRYDLAVKYKFTQGLPQEVSFLIDATGTTFDLVFQPKGGENSVADVYIQKQ